MDLHLFQTLEVVLRAYSRQPPRKLIDHYLRIRILLRISPQSFSQFASHLQLSPSEQLIFANKTKLNKNKRYACLIIDHPLSLPLGTTLLQQIQQCLVVNEGGTCSNLIGVNKGSQCLPTRAVLLKVAQTTFDQLKEQLDAYLSVCEVFMGHLHLTVSCFQASLQSDLVKEIQPTEGDQFADFREEGYFRCLEERASRITLQELSDSCRVERQEWGELLVFEGGSDCLIVWLTLNRLPFLGTIPDVSFSKKRGKGIAMMIQSPLGFKIFKRKELMKMSLSDLQTTTMIFNVREKGQLWKNGVSQLFLRQAELFLSRGSIERNSSLLQESIELCERIGEILDLPVIDLVKKIINN